MENEIRTYGLTNEQNEKVDFVIKDIGNLFDQFHGINDTPHRHEYYTIILTEKGSGIHSIDFKEFEIKDFSLHFVYPGQVHNVYNPVRPSGWVMNFTREFLLRSHIMQDLINQVYLYNTYGDSPPLQLNKQEYDRFNHIIQQFLYYSDSQMVNKFEAIGAVLKLFFINVTALCSVSNYESVHSSGVENLIVKFKNLIDSNYKTWHKVSEYAMELSVSSDYLNKYVKSKTTRSAKEFIQEKIIVEAKRILLFTDESNKELAYNLGFEEPAHFSNFFKKQTGLTPGNFRTETRKENVTT